MLTVHMYKYKKHKHAYICTHANICMHKRTFTLIHTHTHTVHITHTHKYTHARSHNTCKHTLTNSQVCILSDMHEHENSSIFT